MTNRHRNIFKFIIWLLFFITFTSEFVKIMFELNPGTGHKPLGMANAFFWSSLFLIEMIMAGFVTAFIIKYPSRRLRLIILSVSHFTVILLLPTVLDDWSWTCLLYPWPHSMQAFDPNTPQAAFYLSLLIGFVIVPLITYRWGAKAFCGYLCPHGAFFSETYGRLFPARYKWVMPAGRFVPGIYFLLMAAALLSIIFIPDSVYPIRSVQKLVYFITAEFFFFVIGIPLIGGRSYCRLICPMGYFIKLIIRVRQKTKPSTKLKCQMSKSK